MSDQKVLILAEHNHQKLKKSTFNVLGAAKCLGGKITLLITGHQCDEVAIDASTLDLVNEIIVLEAPCYEEGLAENIAFKLAELGKGFDFILAAATTYGKNILPRVAGILGVAQISDILKIETNDTFVRPIYAGNALETVQSLDALKIITVRTTAFKPISNRKKEAVSITKINETTDLKLSQFVRREMSPRERPELTSARVVISGGRGLQSAENFKLLEDIADKLHAAIGASRAAVDAGFVPNDYQVGQTGKVVAPDLYIAVGISGAIQHLAGMKDSKVIVAINKDPDAPIFQIADYGLVGDLFQILPELNKELKH